MVDACRVHYGLLHDQVYHECMMSCEDKWHNSVRSTALTICLGKYAGGM